MCTGKLSWYVEFIVKKTHSAYLFLVRVAGFSLSRSGRDISVHKDKLEVEALPVVLLRVCIGVKSVTFERKNVCAVEAQELQTLLRVHL